MKQEQFAKIIREKRKEKRMTQQQLAALINTSLFTVNQFERGKGNVGVDTLCKMLTALDIRLVQVDKLIF